MKIVLLIILCVHDPSVKVNEGWIDVQSFIFWFRIKNHFPDTRLVVMSKSIQLLVRNNKRPKRSTMNDEPNRWIVVPTPNDPSGHHNTRFTQEPWL